MKSPRMFVCLLLALCLLATVYAISPQQAPVIAYKLALILLAAFAGYWIDRWGFPYARPDGYLGGDWRMVKNKAYQNADYRVVEGYHVIFAITLIRRAIIMGCTMLAVGMGL